MKWKKFTLTTTTQAVDLVSSMLDDIGIEGAHDAMRKIRAVSVWSIWRMRFRTAACRAPRVTWRCIRSR